MISSTMILAVCACALLYFLLKRWMCRQNSLPLPPGPPGYPLIGSILDVDISKLHLSLMSFSQTYGDVMSVNLLGTTMVVLSSTDAIREAMTTKPFNTAFASRPDTFAGRYLMYNFSDIVLAQYSKSLIARRKVGHRLLKVYGAGNKNIERVVMRELRAFVKSIENHHQAAFDPTLLVHNASIDVIGELVSMSLVNRSYNLIMLYNTFLLSYGYVCARVLDSAFFWSKLKTVVRVHYLL
jgi:hypothetical protein